MWSVDPSNAVLSVEFYTDVLYRQRCNFSGLCPGWGQYMGQFPISIMFLEKSTQGFLKLPLSCVAEASMLTVASGQYSFQAAIWIQEGANRTCPLLLQVPGQASTYSISGIPSVRFFCSLRAKHTLGFSLDSLLLPWLKGCTPKIISHRPSEDSETYLDVTGTALYSLHCKEGQQHVLHGI